MYLGRMAYMNSNLKVVACTAIEFASKYIELETGCLALFY